MLRTKLCHSVNGSDVANKALTIRSGGYRTSELLFASAEIRRLLSYSAQASDAAELFSFEYSKVYAISHIFLDNQYHRSFPKLNLTKPVSVLWPVNSNPSNSR